MRKFWGFYKNESYSVGCNGGTVYIYDSTGTELAKFRDFPYAYTAVFKPGSNVIAVKSTEGFLGFYDLDSLALIKKITVTRIGAQDEGFAFTPDGRYFYNIEKPVNSCQTQLSIYDAVSFEKMKTLFTNEKKWFWIIWNSTKKQVAVISLDLCVVTPMEYLIMVSWEDLMSKVVLSLIVMHLMQNSIIIFNGINRGKKQVLQRNHLSGIH